MRRASLRQLHSPLRWALVCIFSLTGCGEDGEAPISREVKADAHLLQDIMAEDPAGAPLDEVEAAVADDRPVLAADLLERGAIPAARRQVQRLEDATMRTDDGRVLRRDAVSAYRDRLVALEGYRSVLERGMVEDLALVEAMGETRRAEVAILELHRRLADLRPLAEEGSGLGERIRGGAGPTSRQ